MSGVRVPPPLLSDRDSSPGSATGHLRVEQGDGGVSDHRLVEAARAGSRDAADALFARHWPSAWRAAYAILGERHAADDAAQRAVERAFRRLDSFRESRPFGPWLRRIAVNQAIDALRRRRDERSLPEELPAADPYGEVVERDAMLVALGRLPEERRVVIVMRYWLDLDPPEIAAVLDVPRGTVSSRLSRGLSELRRLLEEG